MADLERILNAPDQIYFKEFSITPPHNDEAQGERKTAPERKEPGNETVVFERQPSAAYQDLEDTLTQIVSDSDDPRIASIMAQYSQFSLARYAESEAKLLKVYTASVDRIQKRQR
jgi:hypothetical protein